MKATKFTHKILTIFLVGLLFCFNSCNSDDDDEPATKTFLELYGGTTWVISEGDFISYLRLINNENIIAEAWEYWDVGDCYEHDNTVLEGNIEILENSETKFVVRAIVEGYTETVTLTMQGGMLKVFVQWTEGTESGEETIFFDNTSVNVDTLELCPD